MSRPPCLKRLLLVVCALLLPACQVRKPNGAVGFVVNQHARSGETRPGKSYTLEPCRIAITSSGCRLSAGARQELQLDIGWSSGGALDTHLGQTLSGGTGRLVQGGKNLQLEAVAFTLQARNGDQVGGNFNARVHGEDPPWDVVGNFEATLDPSAP